MEQLISKRLAFLGGGLQLSESDFYGWSTDQLFNFTIFKICKKFWDVLEQDWFLVRQSIRSEFVSDNLFASSVLLRSDA